MVLVTYTNMVTEIKAFAQYLRSQNPKWSNIDWVKGQHDSHITECAELKASSDPHLQAELLDKAIIACVLESIADPKFDPVPDLNELKDDCLENGIVEFKTFNELVIARREKFKSKLHLTPTL